MNKNIEDGIDRFIKYIRRMSILSDDQLRAVINHAILNNSDSYMGIGLDIDGHIRYIRSMSTLTDDQLRHALRESVKDPVMHETFEDAAKKKALLDMQKMAKEIRGDPRTFARRVDHI